MYKPKATVGVERQPLSLRPPKVAFFLKLLCPLLKNTWKNIVLRIRNAYGSVKERMKKLKKAKQLEEDTSKH